MSNTPPINFWSFSALRQFEKCPYSIYLKRVERLATPPEDPHGPLAKGRKAHEEAEAYIKGEGPLTPILAKHYKTKFEELRTEYDEGRVLTEDSWWFNREWELVDKDAPDKWLIVILDAFHKIDPTAAKVTDFKTGKSFGKEVEHLQQLQLYSIAAFMIFAELQTVEASLWYLEEKRAPLTRKYTRNALPRLLEGFSRRGDRLTAATDFPPKPNKSNCRYCDYGPNNGTGDCAYGIEI